jgi:hypothetical protein
MRWAKDPVEIHERPFWKRCGVPRKRVDVRRRHCQPTLLAKEQQHERHGKDHMHRGRHSERVISLRIRLQLIGTGQHEVHVPDGIGQRGDLAAQ